MSKDKQIFRISKKQKGILTAVGISGIMDAAEIGPETLRLTKFTGNTKV